MTKGYESLMVSQMHTCSKLSELYTLNVQVSLYKLYLNEAVKRCEASRQELGSTLALAVRTAATLTTTSSQEWP